MKLKLLKDWSHEGTDYKSGTELEISKSIGVLLIEMEKAELVGEAEPDVKPTKAKADDVADKSGAPTFTKANEDEIVARIVKGVVTTQTKAAPIDVRVVKNLIDDDPKRGFKTPRHFLKSVIDCEGMDPSGLSDGLKSLWSNATKAAGSDEQMVISDPYGGFLVPPAFHPELLMVGFEGDPTAGLTRAIPMEGPTVKIPARVDKNHKTSVSGGLTVSRRVETVAMTASRMEIEQIRLDAHTLFGVAIATEEILTDSKLAFVAILEAGFRDEFASAMLDEKLNGTGVGQFEGVIGVNPATIDVTAEQSQAATTIVYENVVNMRSRCWHYSNAIWLANHDTLPQLMKMTLDIGTAGHAMWQPSAREDHPDLLFGRPIFFTEYCSTLGTTGDLVLGVWSEYLEGTLQPLQSAESIHVRFLNHERTFKFWQRNDARSWWRSALTPVKSSTTLSPFLTLATRA